ncbi:MAG: hypothetical protein P9L98_04570 [Candidatus Kaelpia imicola]|nr:hypothetical protein [Candidatus Kaelpia imicola]
MKKILSLHLTVLLLFSVVLSSIDTEQSLPLRRIKSTSFIEDIIGSRNIKLVGLDLDFTLSEPCEPITIEVIEQLIALNKEEVHICIITGALFKVVENRVLNPLRNFIETEQVDFDWEKFYLFTETGSSGYIFNSLSEERRIFHREFDQMQNDAIDQAWEDFNSRYGKDSTTDTYRTSGKSTVYFKSTGIEPITEYVNFLREKLQGLDIEITAGGNLESIDLTCCNKGEAVSVIQSLLGLRSNELMLVGDSFKYEFSNDRHMAANGALVFNVGEKAENLEGAYNTGELFPYLAMGPQRTLALLRVLEDRFTSFNNIFRDIREG